MKFQSIVPIIWTHEIDTTIDFYCAVLGFTCDQRNDDWNWAALHKDDCEIMVANPNAHTPFEKPTFTGSLYIKVDDVDFLWHSLKDKVKVCYEIETFEWGMREFAIYDTNGYLLQFGQDMTQFL
jgi:uncharacterized glyoxalase superfamily protein PhnB